MRAGTILRIVWLALAALLLGGCNTNSTPTFPTPDFQVPLGEAFVLRVGDLGLIAAPGQYLYLSVLTLGLDSRCPPEATCADPGFLEISFEVETAESQSSIQMRAPPEGETTRSFGDFRIRIHRVAPPGQRTRIPTTDYQFLMSVTLGE